MSEQPEFDFPRPPGLCGDISGTNGRGELGAGDAMPPGPYTVGLTHGRDGDTPPWTVVCADGRAVAGHVPSLQCAQAIVRALNGGRE